MKNNLDGVTDHMLRAWWAERARCCSGIEPKIAELLGHRDQTTTLYHYARPRDEPA